MMRSGLITLILVFSSLETAFAAGEIVLPTDDTTWKVPGMHNFRAENCDPNGIYQI